MRFSEPRVEIAPEKHNGTLVFAFVFLSPITNEGRTCKIAQGEVSYDVNSSGHNTALFILARILSPPVRSSRKLLDKHVDDHHR